MRQHQFPLSTMYIEELWSLRTTKCGDSVVQMIRNIPSFQACQSSFYRNWAKTTPKLRTSQKEINLDQLEKNSSSVTTLMPRDTEMTESWYFQRTQTFNVCSGDNAQWWNLSFAYKIINTDIHPACPSLSFTQQDWWNLQPFLCVIEVRAIREQQSVLSPELW